MIPPMKEITGAEMVIQALKDHGVEHIFGYPGGAVLPIYDALFAANDLVHVLVRHEQGAIHAAGGWWPRGRAPPLPSPVWRMRCSIPSRSWFSRVRSPPI